VSSRASLTSELFDCGIPLSRPLQQHVVFRCASGIIAGTSRVGYLREHGTQFSLGGGWTNGSLYGFDENDGPITDETPALQQFRSTHPDLVVWLVSCRWEPRLHAVAVARVTLHDTDAIVVEQRELHGSALLLASVAGRCGRRRLRRRRPRRRTGERSRRPAARRRRARRATRRPRRERDRCSGPRSNRGMRAAIARHIAAVSGTARCG